MLHLDGEQTRVKIQGPPKKELSVEVFFQLPKPKKRGKGGSLGISKGNLYLDGELLLEEPRLVRLDKDGLLFSGFEPQGMSKEGIPLFRYQEILVLLY